MNVTETIKDERTEQTKCCTGQWRNKRRQSWLFSAHSKDTLQSGTMHWELHFNKNHLNWKKIEWIEISSDFFVFDRCLLLISYCRQNKWRLLYVRLPFFCVCAVVRNAHCYCHYFFSFIPLTFSFAAIDPPRRRLWPGRSLTNNLASVPLPKVPSLPLTLPQMPSFSAPAWMGPLCENTYVWRDERSARGLRICNHESKMVSRNKRNTQTWTQTDPKTTGPVFADVLLPGSLKRRALRVCYLWTVTYFI